MKQITENIKEYRKKVLAGNIEESLSICKSTKNLFNEDFKRKNSFRKVQVETTQQTVCIENLMIEFLSLVTQTLNSKSQRKVKPPLSSRRSRDYFKKENFAEHLSKGKNGKNSSKTSKKDIILQCKVSKKNVTITFDDVIGASDAKRVLEESIAFPKILPSFFNANSSPWKGILIFGPPGTGKTLIAKAVCFEFDLNFYSVSSAVLCNKLRGESEKMIKSLFEHCRAEGSSVIFLDEIDSIFNTRYQSGEHEASRRMKSELLLQIDGINASSTSTISDEPLVSARQTRKVDQSQVLVLAATNFPWCLDEALIRRLEKRIYLALPNFEERNQLFRHYSKSGKLANDIDFNKLALLTEGYSGADVSTICKNALLMPLRRVVVKLRKTNDENNRGLENLQKNETETPMPLSSRGSRLQKLKEEVEKGTFSRTVVMKDFLVSVENTKTSVDCKQLRLYVEWNEKHGSK